MAFSLHHFSAPKLHSSACGGDFAPSVLPRHRRRTSLAVRAAVSAPQFVGAPDELVSSILSKVKGTDGGVSLTKEGHKEVADLALQLQKYCVDEPVKCPLIFGDIVMTDQYYSRTTMHHFTDCQILGPIM